MGVYEILEKIRALRQHRAASREQEIPDNETRDRYLRSLRRQRRTQMEMVEKKQLKKDINDFNRDFVRDNMWGIKGENRQITHQDFNILSGGRKQKGRRMGFL